MDNQIWNPKTNKFVSIFSGEGKIALKSYLQSYNMTGCGDKAKDKDIVEHVNNMNKKMMDTLAKSTETSSYYPVIIAIHSGMQLKLKIDEDGPIHSFDMFDGVLKVWIWGKGICHLIVWVSSIVSKLADDSKFDWKTNLNEQLVNVVHSIKLLSTSKKLLLDIEKYKSKTDTTTNPPFILTQTVDQYVDAARKILNYTKSFIEDMLKYSKFDVSKVEKYILDTNEASSYLTWAITDILINRGTRAMLQWKEMMGEKFNQLYVIISSGVTSGASGTSTVITPRGSCNSGNHTSQIFKNIMTKKNYEERVMMYNSPSLNFNDVKSIINPHNLCLNMTKHFSPTTYSSMLKIDLITPNNALLTQFSDFSAENTVANCFSHAPSQSTCPFDLKLKNKGKDSNNNQDYDAVDI